MKVCRNCGSSSFVSDRSLGGKIICVKCGCSLFKTKPLVVMNSKYVFFIVIGIIAFFIIVKII